MANRVRVKEAGTVVRMGPRFGVKDLGGYYDLRTRVWITPKGRRALATAKKEVARG